MYTSFHVCPGEPGTDQVVLYRVSMDNDDAAELRRMLSDYELPTSSAVRQTGGAVYAVLTVALASGGAVTALVHVLHKFLDLRRDKSIHIETADGLKVMTKGASIGEVERALRAVSELSED